MDFGLFWTFFFGAMVLGVLHLVGQIVALLDILRRQDPQMVGDSRLLWVLIVIFLPFGWLVYFVAGRR